MNTKKEVKIVTYTHFYQITYLTMILFSADICEMKMQKLSDREIAGRYYIAVFTASPSVIKIKNAK